MSVSLKLFYFKNELSKLKEFFTLNYFIIFLVQLNTEIIDYFLSAYTIQDNNTRVKDNNSKFFFKKYGTLNKIICRYR